MQQSRCIVIFKDTECGSAAVPKTLTNINFRFQVMKTVRIYVIPRYTIRTGL